MIDNCLGMPGQATDAGPGMFLPLNPALGKRDKHCCGLPVANILFAENADQVTFFKPYGGKHVTGCQGREEQMRYRHCGCCPEGYHPTQVQGMTNVFIEQRRPECERHIRNSPEIKPTRTHTEQAK